MTRYKKDCCDFDRRLTTLFIYKETDDCAGGEMKGERWIDWMDKDLTFCQLATSAHKHK